jgi:CRP-like cAMP-binding protein
MEIHPTNIAEQLYSCFVTMFWLILCSLFFSCMTLWAIQLRDLGLDREKQEALVRTFVKERRISDNLSNKVIRFFRLNYNKLTLRKKESAIPLFNDLPIDMRIEVHKEVYRPMLRKHPAFPLLFDEDSINSICHLVTVDMHYLAGQTIFSEEEEATAMLFIFSGELAYYFESQRGECTDVGPDSWVTEAALWRPWKHVGCLITGTSCEVVNFEVNKFHAVVASDPARMSLLRMYARLAVDEHNREETNTDLWTDLDTADRLARQALAVKGEQSKSGRLRVRRAFTLKTLTRRFTQIGGVTGAGPAMTREPSLAQRLGRRHAELTRKKAAPSE